MFIGHYIFISCIFYIVYVLCSFPFGYFFHLLICKHETEQDPVGLQGTKSLSVHFLFVGNSLLASLLIS